MQAVTSTSVTAEIRDFFGRAIGGFETFACVNRNAYEIVDSRRGFVALELSREDVLHATRSRRDFAAVIYDRLYLYLRLCEAFEGTHRLVWS